MSGSGSTFVRRLSSMSRWLPPGKSVRPIEPANSTSPEKTSDVDVRRRGRSVRNIVEPAGVAGRVQRVEGEARDLDAAPSTSSRTSSGSVNTVGPASCSTRARVSAPIAR